MDFGDILALAIVVYVLYKAYQYSKGDDIDEPDDLTPGYH